MQADWPAGVGVDLVRGHGRLAGERIVRVDTADGTVTLIARRAVVVATGSTAAVPPIEGLREIAAWDNRDVTAAKQVPARLLVLGGGVVGVGTELTGDEVLVAVGRRPNTDDIGLDTVGLDAGGHLDTDDRLRVRGVDGGWLYAAGDVNGRALLTHQGKYQARLVGAVIAGGDVEAWADHRAVPRVTFTDPQIAAVGKTERQARDAGVDVRAVRYDVGATAAGALAGKGVHGTAQLVIDQSRRVIVGATFVGPGVGELLHAATIAIVGEVPLDTLWRAVPAFLTLSEVWLRLLETERGVA